jgi:hypothetical protein
MDPNKLVYLLFKWGPGPRNIWIMALLPMDLLMI